jgi:hypothetical protein
LQAARARLVFFHQILNRGFDSRAIQINDVGDYLRANWLVSNKDQRLNDRFQFCITDFAVAFDWDSLLRKRRLRTGSSTLLLWLYS